MKNVYTYQTKLSIYTKQKVQIKYNTSLQKLQHNFVKIEEN